MMSRERVPKCLKPTRSPRKSHKDFMEELKYGFFRTEEEWKALDLVKEMQDIRKIAKNRIDGYQKYSDVTLKEVQIWIKLYEDTKKRYLNQQAIIHKE
jgi:hypothetical protein